jgi:hypothetical protein
MSTASVRDFCSGARPAGHASGGPLRHLANQDAAGPDSAALVLHNPT